MGYVIIGNSTAAIGAVEGIRKYDQKTAITIISDEPYLTYSRPLISYFLGGKVTEENMRYRNPDFYQKNHVRTMLGIRVASINLKEKKVILDNGENVSFSKLLIATGSKPFIPPMEGLGKENIFNFLKLDDVKGIKKVSKKGSKAVVVGASFSGLKAVEALVHKGVDVTVIDIMSRIMPRVLDDDAASLIKKNLEEKGVKFFLNNTVEKILGEDKATGVLLKDGTQINCDFIILAIGVRCNIDLVKETEINTNRGIVVNSKMQTNVQSIYAAGDIAEAYSSIENRTSELPILPNAYYQGETAGANMAGEEKTYDEGFVMNSMPLLGLSIISAGASEEKEGIEVLKFFDMENSVYKKFYIKGNLLAGYLLIENVDRAGIYTDLIRSKTDISAFKEKLIEDEFGFINLPKPLRKEKMLKGGAVK